MATTTHNPWTADELRRLPEGWRYEIDEGELVIMPPAGFEHNDITTTIVLLLGNYVRKHHLGKLLTNELGVYLSRKPRETLRGIDVAFYSNERLARITDRKGFPDVPPDLAVEVHDASEPDLRRKIEQYLSAGVGSVWVVDPDAGTLTRHVSGELSRVWSDLDAVVLEPALPGFSCRLRELLGEE